MVKTKNDFYLSEGMKNCRMSGKSGKSQGILRWMISGNPDNFDLWSLTSGYLYMYLLLPTL